MRKLIAIALLIVPGIALAEVTYLENTLGANKVVPNKMIENSMDADVANVLLQTPYTGFYRIDGKVRDNKMSFEKVKDKYSFPDGRLEPLALGITGLMKFPVYTTGSRVKTQATAYVAFYKDKEAIEGLDIENVMRIPTSVQGEPNTLAVVIVKSKEPGNAKDPNLRYAGTDLRQRDGTRAYFFEVAI